MGGEARVVFLPTTPLLLPEIATGASADLDALRDAARAAVDWVFETASRVAVVVPGTAPASLASWSLAGFGVPVGDGPPLDLAPAIAAWLLAGRPAQCVGTQDPTAILHTFDGVLVMGDGSACRTDKAPGHIDERAVPFDEAVLAALARGDAAALAHLDLELADEVMASGAAAWQRLGTAVSSVLFSRIDVAEDPYGVLYVVARWIAQWEGPA